MSAAAIDAIAAPPVTARNAEIKLIDQLLEGWGLWAARGDVHLSTRAVGYLWRIPNMLELRHELVLTDDRFGLVDRHIARLPPALRQIAFVEYVKSAEIIDKPKRVGLSRLAYRQLLFAAQWALYVSLEKEVQRWIDSKAGRDARAY